MGKRSHRKALGRCDGDQTAEAEMVRAGRVCFETDTAFRNVLAVLP